jgi:outer membrane receptor for ferrienterochelin and colicins
VQRKQQKNVSADGMLLVQANVLLKKPINQSLPIPMEIYHKRSCWNYEIAVSYTGFRTEKRSIRYCSTETTLDFVLRENNTLDEVVITGTMKPVSRLESPVPVEVYKPSFF